MHRGIHVPEIPLVCGDLAVGVQVTGLEQEFQLVFAEFLINQRQRRDMKGQIPGGVPGILPFIRHRDNIRVDHVSPAIVADGTLIRFVGLNAVLFEPAPDVIAIELLGPEHPGQSLPHDTGLVGGKRGRDDGRIKLIGFLKPGFKDRFKRCPEKFAKCV